MAMTFPSTLELKLGAPGMGPMHRAGLGGLAATLVAMEQAHRSGKLKDSELPGPLRDDGSYPWSIGKTSLTLDFAASSKAESYLKKLFAFAFGLNRGLIYLPGQYADVAPMDFIRAHLQAGICLSFYGHASRTRQKLTTETRTQDVDGQLLSYDCLVLEAYKHQTITPKGITSVFSMVLRSFDEPVPLTHAILPGIQKRHDKLNKSEFLHDKNLLIPAVFALSGCIAIPAGGRRVRKRGAITFAQGGAVIVPEVYDLADYAQVLPVMLPTQPRDCIVSTPDEAALALELRLKYSIRRVAERIRIIWCCPNVGNSQQAPICEVFEFETHTDDSRLDVYQIVRDQLGPRRIPQKDGSIRLRVCHLMSLASRNVTKGEPWYCGFSVHVSGSRKRIASPIALTLHLRKELNVLCKNEQVMSDAERSLVAAIQQALEYRFAQVSQKADATGKNIGMGRREKEADRWRYRFLMCMTSNEFRKSVVELFARAGRNQVLRDNWEQIIMLCDGYRWERSRDLALVAIVAYPV